MIGLVRSQLLAGIYGKVNRLLYFPLLELDSVSMRAWSQETIKIPVFLRDSGTYWDLKAHVSIVHRTAYSSSFYFSVDDFTALFNIRSSQYHTFLMFSNFVCSACSLLLFDIPKFVLTGSQILLFVIPQG